MSISPIRDAWSDIRCTQDFQACQPFIMLSDMAQSQWSTSWDEPMTNTVWDLLHLLWCTPWMEWPNLDDATGWNEPTVDTSTHNPLNSSLSYLTRTVAQSIYFIFSHKVNWTNGIDKWQLEISFKPCHVTWLMSIKVHRFGWPFHVQVMHGWPTSLVIWS